MSDADETATDADAADGATSPDETVLVTGCSSGIGAATARAFRDVGWTVYATARDPADVPVEGCRTLELDVTDPQECKAAVERVVEETGRLDCLVNNAGFGQFGPVEDVPPRKVHRQFDVNLYGPHRLIRHALPHMRERESGTVVNVSSVYGRVVTPGAGAYAASKFGLEALSDALRPEVSSFGVDVVLVEPGGVDTGFSERVERESEGFERTEAYDYLYDVIDDQRLVSDVGASDPEEVAAVVRDAAVDPHPDARYVVGDVARLSVLAGYLPDRIRDGAFRLLGKFVRG